MKILLVNTYCRGSTGTIANRIADVAFERGHEVVMCYGREKRADSTWIYIGTNKLFNFISNVLVYVTGLVGGFHFIETYKLIKVIKKEKPDLIHFHNIHGNYLNFGKLFRYLKKNYVNKTIFTTHDDFLYTGRCASAGCPKWVDGCSKCKRLEVYPHVLIDFSKSLMRNKKIMLSELNPCIVLPSEFMLKNFENSKFNFLDHVKIHNTIIPSQDYLDDIQTSKFDYNRYLFDVNKTNIICVASPWSEHKGTKFINFLDENVDKNKINLVVVGVTEKTKPLFNPTVKTLGFLNRKELNILYRHSDATLIASRREASPLVLIESLVNGTPVISFDNGPSKYIITEESGIVVKYDKEELLKAVNTFDVKKFDKELIKKEYAMYLSKIMEKDYVDLYESILLKGKKYDS